LLKAEAGYIEWFFDANHIKISKLSIFFSNEGYGKPHIHVESGDNYAKYWLRASVKSPLNLLT